VVVDLDGVRFMGSAGLSVLFDANELATREDRDLRLVCNSRTANLALEARTEKKRPDKLIIAKEKSQKQGQYKPKARKTHC